MPLLLNIQQFNKFEGVLNCIELLYNKQQHFLIKFYGFLLILPTLEIMDFSNKGSLFLFFFFFRKRDLVIINKILENIRTNSYTAGSEAFSPLATMFSETFQYVENTSSLCLCGNALMLLQNPVFQPLEKNGQNPTFLIFQCFPFCISCSKPCMIPIHCAMCKIL